MTGSEAEVASVGRRLTQRIDPLDLYAKLTARERRDTALFECDDGISLIMPSAAVRIECRDEMVTMSALTVNGEALLASAGKKLADYLVSSVARTLVIRIPRSKSHDAGLSLIAPAPLHAIRAVTGLHCAPGEHPFAALVLGIVAFDYAARAEGLDGSGQADPFDFPDFIFWVPESLILFEASAAPLLLCTAFGSAGSEERRRNFHDAVGRLGKLFDECDQVPPAPVLLGNAKAQSAPAVDLDDERFCEVVRQMQREIAAGEIYQIVPSRTFSRPCPEPLASFASLRALESSAYRYFADAGAWSLFGASPETSVRTIPDAGVQKVEVRPIAGTRPRGATADEDDRMEAELRLDAKELAEHMMLVDLARNDVARVSKPGTRRVEHMLSVKRHARVMHLESSVTGVLRDDLDSLDALAACLNVGTLTGAPKIRATELLYRTEATRRGPYGGAIGWINGAGAMDTSVIIRSALVQDGTAQVRAGAGVVFDSDPEAECEETRRKASMLLSVLADAELAA